MHKKLPHISLENYFQFITFRTYESFDLYATKIATLDIDRKKKEYLLDAYLDNSKVGAYFFDENIELMKEIIYEKNNILYEIEIFVIMPNHIHLLLKQIADLKEILKYIKGKSAIEFNKKFNRKGKFWHNNYYDRVIRNEKHFLLVYEYIKNNPIKANLVDAKRVFPIYE
jgi:REP element-mobilizing transposase RayT